MPNIVLSRPLFQLLCISWRGYRNAEMSIYLSVSLSLGVIAPNCMHFVLLRFPHHAPLAVIKKTLKQRQLLMVTNGSSNAHEKTDAKLKTRCDSLWPSRLYTRSLSIHKNVKQKSVNIIWNSEGPANPTFHVLGGSERASTDCSHPIVLCPWVTLMRFSWKLSTSMVFMFFAQISVFCLLMQQGQNVLSSLGLPGNHKELQNKINNGTSMHSWDGPDICSLDSTEMVRFSCRFVSQLCKPKQEMPSLCTLCLQDLAYKLLQRLPLSMKWREITWGYSFWRTWDSDWAP